MRIPEPSARPLVENSVKRWTSKMWPWLALVAVVVLAAVVYRPWRPAPLPVSDWGGMLPVLMSEATVDGRAEALNELNASYGRYQPAFMAEVAMTWSAFGDNTLPWQWIRFGVMTGIVAACTVLARVLGASRGASATAAVLLVVSGMAQQSWILPQLPEPRGTLALACAALIAVGYQTSNHRPARAVAIVALLVLAILYKETFIVGVPFVLALALWAREKGQWAFGAPTKRDVVFIGAAALAIGVTNVRPVLSVLELADANAYGARYDVGAVSLAQVRNVMSAVFLPVTRVWLFPANVAFVAAIVVGVVIGVRRHGRSALVSVGVLLSLLVAGVATYVPWFAMEGYYAFAFLPALMALFALALTWLWQSQARTAKALAVGSCGLVAVYGTLLSSNYINAYRASRAVDERTARALDGLGGRTLVAAVPDPAKSGSVAKALRGYALSLGISSVPPPTDVACTEAAALVAQRSPAIVVVFSTFCGTEAVSDVPPARVIRESYVARDWKTFARSRQEVSARIWSAAASADAIAERRPRGVQGSRATLAQGL